MAPIFFFFIMWLHLLLHLGTSHIYYFDIVKVLVVNFIELSGQKSGSLIAALRVLTALVYIPL